MAYNGRGVDVYGPSVRYTWSEVATRAFISSVRMLSEQGLQLHNALSSLRICYRTTIRCATESDTSLFVIQIRVLVKSSLNNIFVLIRTLFDISRYVNFFNNKLHLGLH
jgi:hypothetical protein